MAIWKTKTSFLKTLFLTFHLVMTGVFLFGKPFTQKRTPQKIKVRHFQVRPKSTLMASTPNTKKTTSSKTKTQPPPKPTLTKKPTSLSKEIEKKKPPPPSKAPIKKSAPVQQEVHPILLELEETIAKIEKKQDKLNQKKGDEKPSTETEEAVPTLPSFEASYMDTSEELITFLHETLQLPDYGRVKVRMNIGPGGIVSSITVLESESSANSKYLESHLPGLKLPMMENGKLARQEKSVIVNFCNQL